MNIKRAITDLIKRKEYLESTAIILDKNKRVSDKTRSIDNTIGYIRKKNIVIKYKI